MHVRRAPNFTLAAVAILCGAAPVLSQSFEPERTADGKPDLNGIWQAVGSAHWDLEGHAARKGPIDAMGAFGAIPAGLGVVVGGEIPYQDWAARKKAENQARWLELDPAVKCYAPGIPRATYMPFPFQIVQTPTNILMAYEFTGASRNVYLNRPDFEGPVPMWMGHSIGRWEGNTLVVEVTSHMPDTWFDSSGNFHGENLKVTERYTPVSPYHLLYEAVVEDPEVFTRPWTIRMPLYRRMEENAQLLEFKCVEFVEEMMYGHLRKGAAPKEQP